MEDSKLHMRIPLDLREELETEAEADDRTLNSFIVHTLRTAVRKSREQQQREQAVR